MQLYQSYKCLIVSKVITILTKSKYFITFLSALFVVFLCAFHPCYNTPGVNLTAETYYTDSLYAQKEGIWTKGDPINLLLTALIVRCCMYSLIVLTPAPSGTITTIFAKGALFGRLYGEVVNHYLGCSSNARVLAICGAGAYCSVMTRTTAPAFIMIELVGDLSLSLPLFVSTFFAYSVASMYTMGLFESLMHVNHTPHLPMLYSSKWNSKKACEVMLPINEFLTEDSTLIDIICLFTDNKIYDMESFIPVFVSVNFHKLRGSIKIQNLVDFIDKEIENISTRLKLGKKHNAQHVYVRFFEDLHSFAVQVIASLSKERRGPFKTSCRNR